MLRHCCLHRKIDISILNFAVVIYKQHKQQLLVLTVLYYSN